MMAVLLGVAMFLPGCKDDEEDTNPISAFDVTISVAENQENGTTLDFLSATSPVGAVTFSIVSETPAGALAVNAATGEVTVLDGSLFNYEIRQVIQAVIGITDGTNTKNITFRANLTDADDIAYLLSTSKAAYLSAANGQWVPITGEEFDDLEDGLLDVSYTGTTEAHWEGMFMPGASGANYSLANDNGSEMPSGSYVFAFRYIPMSSAISGNKVMVASGDIMGPYAVLGNDLPAHGTGGDAIFVLKGANTAVTGTGYLGFYFKNTVGYRNLPGTFYYSSGFNTGLAAVWPADNIVNMYQGLATTIKQW